MRADAEAAPAAEMGDLDDPTAMFGKKKKKKSKDTEIEVSTRRLECRQRVVSCFHSSRAITHDR